MRSNVISKAVALMLFFCVLVCAPVQARTTPTQKTVSSDPIELTKALIRTFYPELVGKTEGFSSGYKRYPTSGLIPRFTIQDSLAPWQAPEILFSMHEVCLREDSSWPRGEAHPSSVHHFCAPNGSVLKPTFSGTIRFSKSANGYIVREVFIDDVPTENKKHLLDQKEDEHLSMGEKIRKNLKTMDETGMTEEELAFQQLPQRLREVGAKYGPLDRKAFLKSIAFKALEPFIGKVRLISAEFGGLKWEVQVQTIAPGKKLNYQLLFEPFEGKLIGIHSDNYLLIDGLPEYSECH